MAIYLHLRASCLKLLGSTWHYGNTDYILRINPLLLSVIGFNNCTQHALRRLAGRQIMHQLRIEVLTILYPARTAGGKMRNLILCLGKAMNKLSCLLHNGEVCRKTGIKDSIKTSCLKSTYQFLSNNRAWLHTKFLTKRNLGSRCRLNNNMLAAILNSCQNILYVALFSNGTRWTPHAALSTVNASYFLLQWQRVIAINAHYLLTSFNALST